MATVDRPSSSPSLLDPDGRPWLVDGERMDQPTFHARYLMTPDGFKAELIGGVVHVMNLPVSWAHASHDANLNGWLYVYSTSTPGTKLATNGTFILGVESEPQPDGALLILPEFGGQTRLDGGRFARGAPELVTEVSASSLTIDLSRKWDDYLRAGVKDYIIADLVNGEILWYANRAGQFERVMSGPDGFLRASAFPGLWLDPDAFLAEDQARVLAVLNKGLASPEHAGFVAELRRRRQGPPPHPPRPRED